VNRNPVQRYMEAFEHLTPSTLQPLQDCFAELARFVDPFSDVCGRSSTGRVAARIFASCNGPRLAVEECLGDDTPVYLRWHFRFGKAASRRRVQGVGRVQFTSDGFVAEQRNYRDPVSQLYERLPLFGQLCRAPLNRLAAPQGSDHDTNTPFSAVSKRNPT